ncbi:MAG: CoA transferase [Myxococcota bacterium]|nr:CoA transferase [Myxococcota bacterium]
MPGPMEGVKVVEMGVWVAGPAAGGILSDWGADVIKIEPPGLGDPGRSFASLLGGDLDMNPIFEMDNRNKRSVILDLGKPEAREVALELIDEADVFITNIRLAALERLGLDPEAMAKRNPRLIYGAITGYGMAGPDRDRAAYDIAAFWARSGIANALTGPDMPSPPFQRGGMGDHGAGLALAAAVSAALYSREKSGRGQIVSTSLLRQGIYTMSFDLSVNLRFGVEIQAADRKVMGNPAMNCYQDRDGRWFWIVGLDPDRHWPPLARAVGHPEWIEDERFATTPARAQNAGELIAMIDEIFATKTRDEWAEVFAGEPDFWWAPVQNYGEVLADPQVHASGAIVEVPDGEATTLLPATPADFAGTPWTARSMAPGHGEHTEAVLRERGRSDEQISALRKKGAIV